jgi:O-antigen/teichoic acid export membrane protein
MSTNSRLRLYMFDSLQINSYLLILIRILGTGFGFLFWALAARTMAAADVGLASAAVSATTLIAGLAQMGLGYGFVRHLYRTNDPVGLFNLSAAIAGLAGLGLAVVFVASISFWAPGLGPIRADPASTAMILLLAPVTALSQLMHWLFLAARSLIYSVVKHSSQALLALVLLFLLRSHLSGYAAPIGAYLMATLLSLGLSLMFLPRVLPGYKLSFSRAISLRVPFAGYAIANFVADQVQRAPDTLLPLIVIQRLGPTVGAYFFVAWTVGRAMGAWSGSVAESLFAEGSKAPTMALTYALRSALFGLLLVSGLALATICVGRRVLAIYGAGYAEHGAPLLLLVTLAALPTLLLSILVNLLRIQNRMRAVLLLLTLASVCGLLSSWLGTSWIGLTGAGAGWLLSQVLVFLGSACWWRWRAADWP